MTRMVDSADEWLWVALRASNARGPSPGRITDPLTLTDLLVKLTRVLVPAKKHPAGAHRIDAQ